MSGLAVLASTVVDPTLEEGGSAGYIALLLVVLIGIATVFLIRNMSGRLKRLPKDFQGPPADGQPDRTDRPGPG